MDSHPEINWPAAPNWALNAGQLGRGFVVAATILFLLTLVFSVLSIKKPTFQKFATGTFILGCLSVFGTFATLMTLLLNKQYEYVYVFNHSENQIDVGYRIAALWGGQEGSFLLWATSTALFGLLTLRATKQYTAWYRISFSTMLAGLSGILAYESPFKLLPFQGQALLPPNGRGLVPALLNYWMQIHPPTIFAGFGSLTVIFAWSVAAMILGDFTTWAEKIRPWAVLSLTLTGIGLCMGGFWAYETLGWGGFWKWDPVENASLVPWLLMAAFLHLLFIQRVKGSIPVLAGIGGALPLVSFNYGTFLTRSGFLGDTSVHSFAEMDQSALKILLGLEVVMILGMIGAAIYSKVKFGKDLPKPEAAKTVFNLQLAYLIGAVLLGFLALCSTLGMSVPLIQSLAGQKPKVVDETLYNRFSSWGFIPLVLIMAIGPYISWRGIGFKALALKLSNVAALTLGVTGAALFVYKSLPPEFFAESSRTTTFFGAVNVPTQPWVVTLTFICLFGIFANLFRIVEHLKASIKVNGGAFLVHAGVIIAMLGLIVSRGLEHVAKFDVQAGRPGSALGYMVSLESMDGDLLTRENRIHLNFKKDNDQFNAAPVLFYVEQPEAEPAPTVRPFIFHRPFYDLYVSTYPLVTEATDPFPMTVGQVTGFQGYTFKYEKFTREGEPGKAGTKFGAQIHVYAPDGSNFVVTPKFAVGQDGPEYIPAQIQNEFFIYLNRMDANTKGITIQLHYAQPVFPLELYFKPLPGLVWWGAGIMTLGGLITVFQRGMSKKARISNIEAKSSVEPSEAAKSE